MNCLLKGLGPTVCEGTRFSCGLRKHPQNVNSESYGASLRHQRLCLSQEVCLWTTCEKAEDVEVGDVIWWHARGSLEGSRVLKVSRTQARGLYNPHTLSGSILVNEVAALTFTEILPRSTWIHSLVTAPAAVVYAISPTTRIAVWINRQLLAMCGV